MTNCSTEQIEAYVARGTDTEIRIYDGEIESLSTATSAGIGIRVLLPGPDGSRVGVAYAGSLDPGAVAAALTSARENATFASPDPMMVLAAPDGITPAKVDLVDPTAHLVSIDDKIALAKAVEAAAKAGDPRIRSVDSADYGDSRSEMALDGEGLACRRNVLIDDGILSMFVYDTVSARRAGAAATGSASRGGIAGSPGAGCRALVLHSGDLSADELLASVGEGLYVQSITGVHSGVSTVSGDFSVGAEGLMIRDGRLAEPIREVTVASSFQRMLQNLIGIGADLTWLPGISAGQTLAIGDVQISGT